MPIEGLDDAEADGAKVFHSGTVIENGVCKANGGRVLCVTALGKTLAEAQAKAYKAVDKIRMEDGAIRRRRRFFRSKRPPETSKRIFLHIRQSL